MIARLWAIRTRSGSGLRRGPLWRDPSVTKRPCSIDSAFWALVNGIARVALGDRPIEKAHREHRRRRKFTLAQFKTECLGNFRFGDF